MLPGIGFVAEGTIIEVAGKIDNPFLEPLEDDPGEFGKVEKLAIRLLSAERQTMQEAL